MGVETAMADVIRESADQHYKEELSLLIDTDTGPKPAGWQMSALAVKHFVLGCDRLNISKKYFGDDAMVERAIVSLMGNQGLMMVGEPGTAKSMLSELLACAISGTSELLIQGTAGTSEEQLKYTWNFALLLSNGPSLESLIKSPVYQAMEQGKVVRIEEITRCPQEIQDALISILSEKQLMIPELGICLQAKPGFNIIATANLADRGVNEMSSALKRRFNFETVPVIKDKAMERELILSQVGTMLQQQSIPLQLDSALVELLVDVFSDLRKQIQGEMQTLNAVLSTAEAVNIMYSSALHCHFMGTPMSATQLAQQMQGTLLKDNGDDKKKLGHYIDVIARERATSSAHWQCFFESGRDLWMRR
uniref:ATP-binding protein n=1 Tax=Thaumasiovibrio occultus TaxID=1891184 RepID=UPI00192CEF34|nr:AAA family ATPase [Thaumasiovibrio occultus]